jgi:Flp pilus assembly protein TadG
MHRVMIESEKSGTRGIRKQILRRSLLPNESGHAFVELALMLPLFSIIIIGAAEFARLTYALNEVSNAAHAGVQFGAQNHINAHNTNGMQQAATNDGQNVKALKATASNFCACSNGTTITCANAATACSARIIQYVQVNTSVSMDPLFHLPGLPTTYTLHGQAIMRAEQ